MSDLTSELALVLAVDNDDTADYLVQTAGLRGSLSIIDGLFNATTGHNHNGAHQGGALVFNQLNTTSIRFANGATLGPTGIGNVLRFQSTQVEFSGAAKVEGALNVTGASALGGGATVTGTLGVTGAITAAGLTVNGTATIQTLSVTGNATVTGTLAASGALTAPSISTGGTLTVSGVTTLNNTVNINGGLGVSAGVTVTGAISSGAAMTATDFTATTGWHRNNAAGTGLYNNAIGIGLRFDTGRNGPIVQGGPYDGARLHGTPHVRAGYFTTPAVAPGAETTVGVTFNPAFPSGANPVAMLTLLRNVSDHLDWRLGLEFGQTSSTGFTARLKNNLATTEAVSVAYLAYWNE